MPGIYTRKESQLKQEQAIRDGYEMGWSFTQLDGKVPIQLGWQKADRPSLNEVLQWAWDGNIGLRTGKASGIVVLDIDKGADISGLDLPKTVTVQTGGGGVHLYYRIPDYDIGNSRSCFSLPRGIDVRGSGGQVVFVGCTHPDSGLQYGYASGLSPEDTGFARWPLERCNAVSASTGGTDKNRIRDGNQESLHLQPPQQGNAVGSYATAALGREKDAVSSAQEGNRNSQLNESAFKIGTLVGSGAIQRFDAEQQLKQAAYQCGLDEFEAHATINSGMNAGISQPRDLSGVGRRPSVAPSQSSTADDGAAVRPYILSPGEYVDANGERLEVGNNDFVEQIAQKLPHGSAYVYGGLPGEIRGEPGEAEFRQFTPETFRFVVDRYLQVKQWKCGKKKTDTPYLAYKPCGRSDASMAIENIQRCNSIPEVVHISTFPIYDESWKLSPPGYQNGIYYDCPESLGKLSVERDVDAIRECLFDLVVDFPFADHSDRENFFGLLLTPIVSVALNSNRPMHLVGASMPRTGKTKLIEEILGGVVLGYPTPAIQFSSSDEEFDKRIVGMLKMGKPIVHLDNLKRKLDSAALASLLTATYYQGRILGTNTEFRGANTMTVVGSGNNVQGSSEIIRRTVPITLTPQSDEPEKRTDFKHKQLRRFIMDNRNKILGCLLGIIENWKAADMPRSNVTLGGFEEWAACVGGMLQMHGFCAWMNNWTDWVQIGDPEREDMRVFVDAWWLEVGGAKMKCVELLRIAEETKVFPEVFLPQTERGRMISLSRKILQKNIQARIGGKRILQAGSGNTREYYLSNEEPDNDKLTTEGQAGGTEPSEISKESGLF